MSGVLFIAGGSIFLLFGCVHAVFMIADLRRPRRLVPADPQLIQSMRTSSVALSRGGTDMWRAWIGFNLSHSLGAAIFGAICVAGGLFVRGPLLLIPIAISCVYLFLALRYWFRAPAIGIGLATALMFTGWLLD